MTFPRIPLLIAAVMSASVAAPPLYADELVLVPADMTFDDAAFSVETTIVGQGLQIEYTSHVGEMLERTRADMGSNVVLFEQANIYLFCSARLSRDAMEADWRNIGFCPYGLHVIQRAGEDQVYVGYMQRSAPGMEAVNAALADMVDEAVSF